MTQTDGNVNRRSLPMSQSAAWSPKRVTTRYWAFGARWQRPA
jgi:hypothetical protein